MSNSKYLEQQVLKSFSLEVFYHLLFGNTSVLGQVMLSQKRKITCRVLHSCLNCEGTTTFFNCLKTHHKLQHHQCRKVKKDNKVMHPRLLSSFLWVLFSGMYCTLLCENHEQPLISSYCIKNMRNGCHQQQV